MRIVFIIQNSGQIYGAERSLVDLLTILADTGHEVMVWLLQETRLGSLTGDFEQQIQNSGAVVKSFPVRSAFSMPLIRSLRRALGGDRPDVLHTIGYKANLHVCLALWNQSDSPVWVCAVHGWLFRRQWKELFYGWLDVQAMKRADAVLVLSEFYQDLIRRRMPLQRIERIPTGLPKPFFEAATGSAYSGPFTVGILGRLSEEKNHRLLLDALATMDEERGVQALIAGEGPLRADLIRRIQSMGLQDRVRLEGYMNQDEFFSRIHVLILCSRIENRPYAVMESMACGIPVIGTRVGGIPELISDGVDGILVEPDVGFLRSAILRLAGDSASRQTMGSAAREKAERVFRAEPYAEEHIRFYRKLCDR